MMILVEEIQVIKRVLQLKSWRRFFSESDLKALLALCLNRTICETNIELKGYFISARRLYLVWETDGLEVNRFINCFLNEFWKVVRHHEKKNHALERYLQEKIGSKNVEDFFEYFDYFDVRLYELLVGKQENKGYLDPVTEDMREYLRKYRYSSYLNYMGEKGPVILHVHH